MLTKTKEKHIEWIMTHPDEKVSISGLSIETGTAYPQTYHNVQDLVKQKIFTLEDIGSSKVPKMHHEAPVEILLSIEAKRKDDFLKKYTWAELMLKDILSYTGEYFFILAVFGSYAKDLETNKSDLDLLLIVPSKEKINSFETAIHKVYTKVKKDAIIVTTEEFVEMIKKNEFNVGNEAKKNHILLYGIEQWYALIKKVQ